MKVYIAGPIRGYSNGNRNAFLGAAVALMDLGHEPVNPHAIDPLEHDGPCLGVDAGQGNPHKYGCYMVPDLRALLDCDGYTLLPGWMQSKGARVEREVADICGKKFVDLGYDTSYGGGL